MNEDRYLRPGGFGFGGYRPGFGGFRPGFGWYRPGRYGYGGGFAAPFLLGTLAGSALYPRPYYPYYPPYPYYYQPYPYYY